ncbi:MAG: GGDEF domain-containing protein [Clostridia bacterium]|nr:GGDEF domain-containing protein [Clostridia bacterium]
MTEYDSVKSENSATDGHSEYYNYKLSVSKKYIRILLLAAALFNIMLLLPDLALIDNTSTKISITIIRSVYSVILFIVGFSSNRIKSFNTFSVIISFLEIIALWIFLYVFSRYVRPNLLIQAMGLMILIIVFFLIPNQWKYLLIISVLGTVMFLTCAYIYVEPFALSDFIATAVYISVTVFLCALSARNSEIHQSNEFSSKLELERLSTTDFLTHAANRYKLEETAARWIAFCRRQGLPLTLVFIDVDDLKIVNDRFGHSIGDCVLYDLAKLFQAQLRSTDILARWGGDEFVMLLPNVTLENAMALTERIDITMKEQTFIDGFNVTCSFGVVEMNDSTDFETLICQADKLMYERKVQSKNKEQYELNLP